MVPLSRFVAGNLKRSRYICLAGIRDFSRKSSSTAMMFTFLGLGAEVGHAHSMADRGLLQRRQARRCGEAAGGVARCETGRGELLLQHIFVIDEQCIEHLVRGLTRQTPPHLIAIDFYPKAARCGPGDSFGTGQGLYR